MGRFWSILFLLVPILGVWLFVAAAADLWPFTGGWLSFPAGHWLPEDISKHGEVIDQLYDFIMYLTGIIFLATGLTMFWFMWRYDGETNTRPVIFSHGHHVLEVVWSVLPAVVLLFIAIHQMNAWADAKIRHPIENVGPDGIEGTADDVLKKPFLEVTGRQFEWRLRYPGNDGQLGTPDDVHLVNDLHVPIDEEIVIAIKSDDVLHSFFLPNLRLKQDVVPGMKQFVWFTAQREGTFDIVCAELCGWGHYKMKGRLTVESREDFDRWMAEKYEQQETSALPVEEEDE